MIESGSAGGYGLSPSRAFSVGGASQFPYFAASSWLGISNSDSLGPVDASFLGTAGADLFYLTRQDGAAFSLDSLTAIGILWGVTSSVGGSFAADSSGAVNFSDTSWMNLKWLAFSAGSGDYSAFLQPRADRPYLNPQQPCCGQQAYGLCG